MAQEQSSRRIEPGSEAAQRLEDASSLCAQGRAAEAIPVLLDLAARFPTDPEVLKRVGGAYFETEEYAEAVRWLVRVLRIEPRSDAVVGCVFSALLQVGRVADAFEFLLRYAEGGPSDEVRAVLKDLHDEPDAIGKLGLEQEDSTRVLELVGELQRISNQW